jgi:hypothetical protein
VELAKVRALFGALETTRAQVSIPAEFVVRLHRNESLRWRADHPLITLSCEAEHPVATKGSRPKWRKRSATTADRSGVGLRELLFYGGS